MLRSILTLCFGALTAATFATAADWPQWRGPNRDGYSAEKNLVKKWPADGPKLLWSITDAEVVGTGYGSPAVVGDRFYILGGTTAKKDSKQFVACLSTKDGKSIWKKEIPTGPGGYSDGWGGGPRATPTVADGYVYVLGPTGDLVCLGADKGDIVWSKNLVKDFKGGIPNWGYSESVLIDDGHAVVTPGGKGGMIALDAKTGEKVWQCTDFTDGAGYSSIIPTTVAGVKQYVQQTMSSGIGVRSKDGKLLWKVGEIKRATAVIPSPVVKDDFVFYTAGYGAGCECFKLTADGDGTKAAKVYSGNKTVANHHGGVISVGDFVYGHSDSSGWVCFPFKSGEDPAWKDKGVGKGSISFADGYLYCYSEGSGTLAVIEPSEKAYKEVGKLKIPETSKLRPNQGKVWAHPVIADGKLFLRDYEKLFVYDLRGQGS